MSEPMRKEMRVEVAQPSKEKEPQKKKELSEKELPLWNFPLKSRSVRAKNLTEAIKKVK